MKTYAQFLIKRIVYRKSNIVFILLMILAIFICFIMNMHSQNILAKTLQEQIATNEQSIKQNQEIMSELPKTSEEYINYTLLIEDIQTNTDEYQKALTYYNEKDWHHFYQTYLDILEQQQQINDTTIQIMQDENSDLQSMSSYIHQQMIYIQYLDNHHLDYENQYYPIYGFTFVTSLSQTLLPIMITVCCIYFLIQLFTMEDQKGIHTDYILPIGKTKTIITKNLVGIGIVIVIYMIIILSALLISFMFYHHIGINYPILIQNGITGVEYTETAIIIFEKWFMIGFLFYINLSLFMYILSLLIKEEGPLLLMGLCLVLGFAYLPYIIGFMRNIVHLFPGVYMNYANIVTFNTAFQLSNSHLSFHMGVIVLFTFVFVWITMIGIILRKHRKT